jgi:thiol:disulfide interchange protein DsbD
MRVGNASTLADQDWKTYSEAAVQSALDRGEPVFVDFTAAWCLTCQVNERLVLSRASLRAIFQEEKVNMFRGDWTNKDPLITAALERVGRAGVPVYLLYAAGAKSPQVLPQILSEAAVLSALHAH